MDIKMFNNSAREKERNADLPESVKEATFVILGGGIAGLSCAEQLAIEEPDCDILLISASHLIKAARNIQKISERLEEFEIHKEPHTTLEAHFPNCRTILANAEEIHNDKHEIVLSQRQIIKYKKLCICTGAIPKVISTANPNVIGIRDTDSIDVFQKKLSGARRVIIVGNGGIATELSYEIENCEIIWVIKDKSISSAFFDDVTSSFFRPCLDEATQHESAPSKRLQYKMEGKSQPGSTMGSALGPDWSTNATMKGTANDTKKVHVEYECEIQNIFNRKDFFENHDPSLRLKYVEEDYPVLVELTNKRIYGCDFVISATGVIPNTSPCDKKEFEFGEDGGLKVDNQMKTNVQDVFAAGDVCAASWPLSRHWFQMRLWTQARQMGAYAAKCMSCNYRDTEAIPDICFDLFTHVTRFYGYKVVLLGLYNGQKLEDEKNVEFMLRVEDASQFVRVVKQAGRMQGAILIGETDLEETFENLILNELDLSAYGEDLLHPHVDIEDYFD